MNKVALLRAARDTDSPSLADALGILAAAGCQSIIVHCWPDARHVHVEDIADLCLLPEIRDGNISLVVGGTADDALVRVVEDLPLIQWFVLTPFSRDEKTTQRGWRNTDDMRALESICARLFERRIVSLFVDPDDAGVQLAKRLGAAAVELNCQQYVLAFEAGGWQRELQRLSEVAERARAAGLAVHLAHNLSAPHLEPLLSVHPDRISVGHQFIAESVLAGLASVFIAHQRALGIF